MSEQEKQLEVIKKLEKLFLDLPVIAAEANIKTDRPFEGRAVFGGANSPSEQIENKRRYKEIREIVYSAKGCLDEWGVVRLFQSLESKASSEINLLLQLAQTTRPEALRGKLSSSLIDNAIKVREREKSVRSSGAGKGNKKAKAFFIVKDSYPVWEKSGDTLESFIEEMKEKAHVSRSTILRYIKKIKIGS